MHVCVCFLLLCSFIVPYCHRANGCRPSPTRSLGGHVTQTGEEENPACRAICSNSTRRFTNLMSGTSSCIWTKDSLICHIRCPCSALLVVMLCCLLSSLRFLEGPVSSIQTGLPVSTSRNSAVLHLAVSQPRLWNQSQYIRLTELPVGPEFCKKESHHLAEENSLGMGLNKGKGLPGYRN